MMILNTASSTMHAAVGVEKIENEYVIEDVTGTELYEEYDEEEYEEEIIYEEIYEGDDIIYEEIIEEVIYEEEDDDEEEETEPEPETPQKKEGHHSVSFDNSVTKEVTVTTSPPTLAKAVPSMSSDWSANIPTAYQLAMDGDYDRLKEILLRWKEQLDDWYNDDVSTTEAAISNYVNAKDEHGRSALFYACNQNSMSMTMLLLSPPFRANPNALDDDGFPPIYVPCERGNIFVVQLLLNFGADANHVVHLDVEENPNRKKSDRKKKDGKKKDRKKKDRKKSKKEDQDKFAWWRLADGSDSEESSNSKIDDDSDPHKDVPSVATPLLAAIFEKREKTVNLLLEHGANPNVVTDTVAGKKSALELATEIVPNQMIEQSLYQHGALTVLSCKLVPTTRSAISPNEILPEWMKRYNR